jgi:peptide/nickel transport system permease protein
MPEVRDPFPEVREPYPAAAQPLPVFPAAHADAPIVQEAHARTPWQIAWTRFKRHKFAMASAIVLLLLVLVTVLAPIIAPGDYKTPHLERALQAPSAHHLFGTNNIGQDMFKRTIYGGRISLMIGFSVALFSALIGTFIGALAGYYGRWLDQILMRITDLFLSIPFLVVLIVAVNLVSGSVFAIVVILTLFFWMPNARIVRGVVLSLKEKEYVEAARSLGASNRRIIVSDIIPNALGPIIVISTLGVAAAILTESALSFLSFGVPRDVPTWGNLLALARPFQTLAPWTVAFPGLFILITVLSVNFLGDGLRDALDPHQAMRAGEG